MASVPAALTEEQYLRLERAAESKSEYHNGRMFAMAGGSMNHSFLATRACRLLDSNSPVGCHVFNSDMRIKVADAGLYTYADGGAVCGEPQLATEQRDCLLNPMLIVEVLSPSTEVYDRTTKFEMYKGLASFREYLLVYQDRRRVEHRSKQPDGTWESREFVGSESSVRIACLGVEIRLADLYSAAVGLPPDA